MISEDFETITLCDVPIYTHPSYLYSPGIPPLFCDPNHNTQPKTMYLTRSEYDRGVNTFSPEGRLFQVEYAIEAVKLGSTAVGIQTKFGVILASEKRLTSTLLEPTSVEKIMEIDSHVAAAVSGLTGDARTLVDHARVEAQNHRFTFDEVSWCFFLSFSY